MPRRPLLPALATAAVLAVAASPGAAGAASGGAAPSAAAATTTAASPSAPAKTTTAAASGSTAVRPTSRATVVLASSARVTARADPNRSKKAGTMKNGEVTRVRCQVNASAVTSSRYGTSRVWNRVKLKNGRTGYVPDVYMSTASKGSLVAPYCGFPDPKGTASPNPGQGRCSSVASVALVDVPTKPGGDSDPAAFVRLAAPFAQASRDATRVPAAVTLAQGILESASGTMAAGANNYFGIKAQLVSPGQFRWGANAVGCVHKQTNEVERGRTVRQIGQFRMYTDMRGSFDDHGLFLVQNSRYAPAFEHLDDPEAFAKAIHKAGYATDPAYSTSLIKLMNRPELNLKQYG